MRKNVLKYIASLSLLLLGLSSLRAGHDEVIASASGSKIAVLPSGNAVPYSLQVEDQQHLYMVSNPSQWPCRFGVKEAKVDVQLRYSDIMRYLNNQSWTLDITYDIRLYNAPGSPNAYTTITAEHAIINYAPTANYQDIFLKSYSNVYGAELTVKTIAYTEGSNPTQATIPAYRDNDIFLDLVQRTERYYNLKNAPNCTTNNAPSVTVTTPILGSYVTMSGLVNATLPIAWNYIEGAESFDVEWLFIDAGNAGTGPFGNTYDVDFSKATRINTPQQFYNIPMGYPKGILLYRVRPIGVSHQAPFTARVEGAWSVNSLSATSINIQNTTGSSYRLDFEGIDPSYNWQYTASFAEEGKRKEVISYFDGSLHNRQTSTILNTDNNVVIAESKYDFQGRPAVSMLPTPVTSTGIHYYNNFNSFDKNSFDTDAAVTASVAPVSATDQTAKYYGNDATASGADALIPDAQGYPYTQIRYKKDGSGAVAAQSGVGPDHRLGSGHETKYFYGAPTGQEELDRLFGNEVGNVAHYKKNMTLDPNGQPSVAYLDQEGRTVATALVGRPSNPNVYWDIDKRPNATSITADMLTGRNIRKENTLQSKTAILVESAAKTYTFNYSLNTSQFCDPLSPCPEDLLCEDCTFDLSFRITDEEGNLVPGTVTQINVTNPPSNPLAPSNCVKDLTGKVEFHCTNIQAATYSVSVTFGAIGTYYVDKVLTVSHEQLDSKYTKDFSDDFDACADSPSMSLSGCENCTSICNQQYTQTDAQGNQIIVSGSPVYTDQYGVVLGDQSQGPALLSGCLAACNTVPTVNLPDECTLRRMALQADMSPGGQYFDNVQDNIIACTSTSGCSPTPAASGDNNNWLTTFITNDKVPSAGNTAFWNAFVTFINDPGNNCGTVTPPSGGQYTWDWVRANWQDCFGVFLMQFHPEYCTYMYFCDGNRVLCTYEGTPVKFSDSQNYDKAMSQEVLSGSAVSQYYNPTGRNVNTTISTTSALASYVPVTGQADPYMNRNCGKYHCAESSQQAAILPMDNYMTNFISAFNCTSCYSGSTPTYTCSGCTPFAMSIWYVLDDPHHIATVGKTALSSLGITDLDPTTVNFFKTLHDSILSASFTKYDYFKMMYQQYKKMIVYGGLKDYTCPSTLISTGTNSFITQDANEDGFANCCHNLPHAQIRIPNNLLYDQALSYCQASFASASSGLINIATNNPTHADNENACAGYADGWISQIQEQLHMTCPEVTLSATDLADMRSYLIAICANSTDSVHPQGGMSSQTEVAPGIKTFDDVYTHYFSSPTNFPSYVCPSFTTNFTLVHPPESYSQANCICENLRTVATANNINWNGSSLASDLYAALTQTLQLSTDSVSISDINDWITNCNSGAPTLSPFFLPSAKNKLPQELNCPSSDTYPEDDPCAQAVDDHNYFFNVLYNQALAAQLLAYKGRYTDGCLSLALSRENLTASYSLDEYYYTLYYYDQAGNLVKTVPPAGVFPLTVSATAGGSSTPNTKDVALYRAYLNNGGTAPAAGYVWPSHGLITNYQYNTLNQVAQQSTPDGGVSNFWYDALGRLVVSKNAKQDAVTPTKAYSYTLFDELGRIYEVGEMGQSTPMTDATAKSPTGLATWLSGGASSKRQITRTFYDEKPTTTSYLSTNAANLYANGVLQNLRNRVSTVTYVEDPSVRSYDNASLYSYDIHGNVQTLYQENRNLLSYGYDINRMDYEYDLVSGKVNAVHYNIGKQDQFHHRYRYDADNRIVAVHTSRNGLIWEKEAKYFYFKHGPLFRSEIGDKEVQASDYAYTLHGWIKGVNSNNLSSAQDIGHDALQNNANLNSPFAKDAYGYTLGYFDNDFNIKNPAAKDFIASTAFVQDYASRVYPLYNGNISTMASTIYDPSDMSTPLPLLRGFMYDQLNRIRWAHGVQGITDRNAWVAQSLGNAYREIFHYDLNGNIDTLFRNDNTASGNLLDQLYYRYNTSGGRLQNNKLNYVTDVISTPGYSEDFESGQLSNNYKYDAIGNLTSDDQEGISNITWNVYGKIKSITKTGTNSDLEFIYDATGNRIQKIEKTKASAGVLKSADQWKITSYVRDAQGNVMTVYQQKPGAGNLPEFHLAEQHIYGSSRIGMVNPDVHLDSIASQKTFATTSEGWGIDISASYDTLGHRILFQTSTQYYGTYLNIPGIVKPGKTYEIRIDADMSASVFGDAIAMGVYDLGGSAGSIVAQILVNGTNTIRFTAPSNYVQLYFNKGSATGTVTKIYFDNFSIAEVKAPSQQNNRTLGEKSYEFSNHLGNVLTVLSDRKHAVQEAGPKNIFKNNFDYSYTPMGYHPGAAGTGDVNGGVFNLHAMEQWAGAFYYFGTITGHTYRVSFDFYKGTSTTIEAIGNDRFAACCAAKQSLTVSGGYSYTFTAISNTSQVIWQNPTTTPCDFSLDNVQIEDLSLIAQSSEVVTLNTQNFEDPSIWQRSGIRAHNGTYSQSLYTAPGVDPVSASTAYGTGFFVAVQPGDYVDAEVYSYYTATTGPQGCLLTAIEDDNGVVTIPSDNADLRDFVNLQNRQPNQWNRLSLHIQIPQNFSYTGSLHVLVLCWNPNTSLTWFDDLKVTTTTPAQSSVVYVGDVQSSTDYYAFGAPLPGRKFFNDKYRYGFNGKENDKETVSTDEGTQDYGLRIYNPAIGKFLSVDPLTASFPWYTPYQFAGNKPIWAIDLDGAEEWLNTQTKFGDLDTRNGPLTNDYANQNGWMPNNVGHQSTNEPVPDVESLPTGSAQLSSVATNVNAPNQTVGNLKLQIYAGTVEYPRSGASKMAAITIAAPQTKNPAGAVITAGAALVGGYIWYHEALKDKDIYVPAIDDVGGTEDPNDPYIMLYRGVYAGHPAYIPALGGTAVPGGDILDPVLHNEGSPLDIARSGFTAWSEYPTIAFQMATRKNTGGVILAKRFKMSYVIGLMSDPKTKSPDEFRQGEILIPGVVEGAIPIPIPPVSK